MKDLELISEVCPRYSKTQPKPSYEHGSAQALSDVPVYADSIEVRANRIDARIVDKDKKRVVAIEMSCPCLDNREVKVMEKTQKYGSLMWELRERNPGYQGRQYLYYYWRSGKIFSSCDSSSKGTCWREKRYHLKQKRRSIISSTLNITRRFKILA